MKPYFVLVVLISFSCSNKYEVEIDTSNDVIKEVFVSENDSTAYLDALEIYYINKEAADRTYDAVSEKLKELPDSKLRYLIGYPKSFKVTSLNSYKTIDSSDFNFSDADIEAISKNFKRDSQTRVNNN